MDIKESVKNTTQQFNTIIRNINKDQDLKTLAPGEKSRLAYDLLTLSMSISDAYNDNDRNN